jgi:hypothetical protein
MKEKQIEKESKRNSNVKRIKEKNINKINRRIDTKLYQQGSDKTRNMHCNNNNCREITG